MMTLLTWCWFVSPEQSNSTEVKGGACKAQGSEPEEGVGEAGEIHGERNQLTTSLLTPPQPLTSHVPLSGYTIGTFSFLKREARGSVVQLSRIIL